MVETTDTDPYNRRPEFEKAMKAHHWTPVYSRGGELIAWQRKNQDRYVTDEHAYTYWHVSKNTPHPF